MPLPAKHDYGPYVPPSNDSEPVLVLTLFIGLLLVSAAVLLFARLTRRPRVEPERRTRRLVWKDAVAPPPPPVVEVATAESVVAPLPRARAILRR